MSLKVTELGKDMLGAFMTVLKGKAPEIKQYAETESKKLAQTFLMIEKLHLSGTITDEEAKLHLDIQKNATRSVLLSLQGLGLLAVEQAINAALNVVKVAVNKAIGIALI